MGKGIRACAAAACALWVSAIAWSTAHAAESADRGSLETALATIKAHRFVDLTHAFAPGIPHWKGAPDERVTTLYTVQKDGFRINEYCHIGQWGTHMDAPAHFHTGLKSVDQIDPRDMLMALVVIDVHEKVAKNPDYTLTVADVEDWEKRHGRVPQGAFVAMRTDWSKRWPDAAALANKDASGVFHYPGWSKEALKLLHEDRRIAASGHETTDTDPGRATTKDDYSLESYILGLNHFQIELLANLDQVPEAGAIVWVTTPKAEDGAGFPARVIAVVP
ncbi:MAG TPA: cyclase family protein [Steroidobacteraceae bacterium]|nr:cyclase family protein [Steroidobacteraceae bacterium]